MTAKRAEIGERLRAYRMGADLSPDEIAKRLNISRAALYKYERTGIGKLETLERLATLVGVSVPSLLGVGVEYYSSAVSFLERKRQLEEKSEQIVSYLEPISSLLTSPDYAGHLRAMLMESIPRNVANKKAALQQIEDVITILNERQAAARVRQCHIISIVSAIQVQRFLMTGLIGCYELTPRVQEQRKHYARCEVERLIALLENEPMQIRIGVLEDTPPNQTFQLFKSRTEAWVAVSPFRLGEFPNISTGVASITAAHNAVSLYTKLADDLWSRAAKGMRGAQILRRIVIRSSTAAT